MNRVQNLRELSVNKILRFTICGNCEIREWQFSQFMAIFSEKLTSKVSKMIIC